MKFQPTAIAGVTVIDLEPRRDERGFFARAYCPEEMAKAGVPFTPVHVNLSRNLVAGTLRGLHYQFPPHGEAKLVRAVRGRIFDVAVDIRPSSPTYGRWHGEVLDWESGRALLIPQGCAHGFLTLEPDCDVLYMASAAYAGHAEAGIRFDDPAIGIDWPLAPEVVSDRDKAQPLLKDAPPYPA